MLCQSKSPDHIDQFTTYDSVFSGIVSSHYGDEASKAHLEYLDLPDEYIELKDSAYYTNGLPIDVHADPFETLFFTRVSKATLVKFYLTHPAELIYGLEYTSDLVYSDPFEFFGRYERSDDDPDARIEYNVFNLYSSAKQKYFSHSFLLTFFFYALYLGCAIYYLWRKRKSRSLLVGFPIFIITLIAFCAIQFILPWVGNGGIDIAKQLYFYNIILDMLIFMPVWLACQYITQWHDKAKAAVHDIHSKRKRLPFITSVSWHNRISWLS